MSKPPVPSSNLGGSTDFERTTMKNRKWECEYCGCVSDIIQRRCPNGCPKQPIEVLPNDGNSVGTVRVDTPKGAGEYFEKRFSEF